MMCLLSKHAGESDIFSTNRPPYCTQNNFGGQLAIYKKKKKKEKKEEVLTRLHAVPLIRLSTIVIHRLFPAVFDNLRLYSAPSGVKLSFLCKGEA